MKEAMRAVNLEAALELPSFFLEEEVWVEVALEEEEEPVSEEESEAILVPEEEVESLAPEQSSLPSTVNLLALSKAEQDNSPVEVKLKPPETLFKESKVPLLNLPSKVTVPAMVVKFGKPSKLDN